MQPTSFFSSPVLLGENGVEEIRPVPECNEFEKDLLEKCLADLEGNISKGVKFTQA